jgi:hypothetical protein
MKEAILIFDIPREHRNIELKAWRDLNKMNAKMIQHSVWESNNLKSLMDIALFVKKSGGEARILEEKFIF